MPTLGEDQLFERYRVIRWLGSGVTGETYEGEDRILQRKVTLKLIHPWSNLTDSARRQFFRELQGISALTHPQIATVLDYGEVEGHMYVARRYVSSGSLLSTNGRQWFRPPLTIADAFKYAHQLAQALQYIHQHGYLHGALTFSNVLVLRGPNVEGEPDYAPFLIADIGLANFVRRFGSPRIETLPLSAAPEQLGKRVTPASDQFALAVLLYFWLTGRPPYLGAPDEIEQLKLSETIPPPSSFNPELTTAQDYLVLRALRTYPDERYPSVLDFTQTLLTTLSPASLNQTTPTAILPDQPETPTDLLYTPVDAALAGSFVVKKGTDQPVHQTITNGSTRNSESTEAVHSMLSSNSSLSPFADQGISTIIQKSSSSPMSIPETPQPSTDITSSFEEIENSSQVMAPTDHLPFNPTLPEEESSITQKRFNRPEPDNVPPDGESSFMEAEQKEPASITEGFVDDDIEEETVPLESLISQDEPDVIVDVDASDAHPTEREHEEIDTSQTDNRESSLPHLIVVSPYTDDSHEFLLENSETNVGRAGSSDLLLDRDNLTSRHHAVVKRLGGRFMVFDKQSYNGVYVNGQKLEVGQGCELADGDHISIGNYELIFRAATSSEENG